MSDFYRWQHNDLQINVKVQPRASKDEIGEVLSDALKIRIKAAPVDGQANSHLVAFLARLFKVPKKHIEVLSGHSSRNKRLLVKQPKQLPDIIKPPTG